MRLAVFSDVHGNLAALEAILADARARADRLICAGDLAWGGPFGPEVIRRVRELGCPCVAGNTDLTLAQDEPPAHPYARWARPRLHEEDLKYLRGLPLEYRVDPPRPAAGVSGGGRLLIVHSAPNDPGRALPDPSQEEGLERLFGSLDAAMVVHGHDHRPSLVRLSRLWVVGTGSVGQPMDGDPRAASYVILTWDEASLAWQVEHRRVAYDVEQASRQARTTDMPDLERWIQAVRRGLPPGRVTI